MVKAYISLVAGALIAFTVLTLSGCAEGTASANGEAAKAEKPAAWSQDWSSVQAAAKESGKPILILFTGSDWCPYCVRLENNVLESQAFKDFAEDGVHLYVADFLRRSEQPAAIERQNRALAERYDFRGFPTLYAVAPDGEAIGKIPGYGGQPADAYVAELRDLLKQR